MKARFSYEGYEFELTTEHAASSHNIPVLLLGGILTNVGVEYKPDEPDTPSVADLLADAAGIWGGSQTRRELADLAAEMLRNVANPQGTDYDRVIEEFERRGKAASG